MTVPAGTGIPLIRQPASRSPAGAVAGQLARTTPDPKEATMAARPRNTRNLDDPFTDTPPDDTAPFVGEEASETPVEAAEAPAALVGVPSPLSGLGLAERAARELSADALAGALNELAHRVRSQPAADRAAILREAAHRVARLGRLEAGDA